MKIQIISKTFVSLVAALCIAMPTSSAIAEVVVIANPAFEGNISKSDLKRLYLGKIKKLGGKSIIPMNLSSDNPVREEFDSGIVRKSPNQLKAYWSRLVFTGKGQPPKEVETDTEMLELVANNPNILGYVSSDANVDGAKIVARF